ncbi:MAG: mechanosensitive ion channel family protein [Bacilli bacterium]|nr:mechanosensitive ion channel family protein [Bacilli bacterium]
MDNIINKQVITSISIILGSIIFYMIFKHIMLNTLLKKARKNSNKKALTTITVATNIVKYMLYIADVLMILDVWGVDTKALLTSLGVIGIIVGLAIQDLLKDIIGGTAILTEDQFKVGDNVKIGDFRGDVISLGLKTTKLRAYTGEVKIIANRNITEVINYSIRSSKSIIEIPASYEDDIDKVKEAIKNICDILLQDKEYLEGDIIFLGIDELSNNSINFKISAETRPNCDIPFKRKALEIIVREFKKQNLQIPYPKIEVVK